MDVKTSSDLWKSYCLKEKLRLLFKLSADQVFNNLAAWLKSAKCSKIPEFIQLYEKIKRHFNPIVATTKYSLTSSKVEATNNIIKSIIRRGFGFRNVNNLMSLIYIRTSPTLHIIKQNRFLPSRC